MKYFFIFFTNFARSYNYSFFTLAALVISEYFLPGVDSEKKLQNFFVLYPIIFWGKPIGSVIFGLIADKLGKIYMIKLTSILSAFSILLLIFIPSYSEIGYLASIFALFCRFIFISTTSIETDALRLFLVEKFQAKILANALISCFSQIAVLFASLVYKYSIGSFWKIGFIIGAILNLSAIFLQNRYAKIRNVQKISVFSKFNILNFKKIFLAHFKDFILFIIIQGILGGLYHYSIIFFSNFLVIANVLDRQYAAIFNIFAVACYCINCFLVGLISIKSKMNVHTQIYCALFCALCILIIQCFAFHVLHFQWMIFVLHILFIAIIPFFSLPLLCYLQNYLSSNNYSLSIYSISHSMGSLLISSNTPVILLLIWKNTSSYLHILQYCIILLILIGFAFTILRGFFFKNISK